MMDAERNERMTRVGPGTPAGELLRRYWIPIAIASELGPMPLRKRLLGEDLVLFRLPDGSVGLVSERCPHRGASLAAACIEPEGIRCGYHGWLFDTDGRCLDQPAEGSNSSFKDRVRARAYRAAELGGLVFAYLGPDPAPLLPRFDLFVWEGVLREIGYATLPCNWLQCMENSVDPHHVEWLHGRFMNFVREAEGKELPVTLQRKHLKTGFDEFEYGIIKRRVLEGHSEDDDDWKIGHPLVFPYMLRVGGGGVHQFQIRVPVDDTHTWHLWYTVYRPETPVPVQPQDAVPAFDVPYMDDKGEFILDFIDGQDIMAWVTQGPIADRTQENLCSSDRGVIMFRRMLESQIDRVEAGEDPLGTVRDPDANVCIELPQERNKYGSGAQFRKDFLGTGAMRHSVIKDMVDDLFSRSEERVPSV